MMAPIAAKVLSRVVLGSALVMQGVLACAEPQVEDSAGSVEE